MVATSEMSKTLAALVDKANTKWDEAKKSTMAMLKAHKAAGEAWAKVRAQHAKEYPNPGKGEGWGDWCRKHLGMSKQYIARMIKLAANWDKVEAAVKEHGPLHINRAYRAACGLPLVGTRGYKVPPSMKTTVGQLEATIEQAHLDGRLSGKVGIKEAVELLVALGWEVKDKVA